MRATDDPDDGVSTRTRRRVLAGAGAIALGGTTLAALSTDRATAQVTMGELTVSGDDATVDSPPTRIDVVTAGEWTVQAASIPDQVQQTLQVHVGGQNGKVDDVAQSAAFGATSGTFDLDADILADHDSASASDFMPADGGESKTTALLVRVIVSAVADGSIVAEAFAEDTADVVLTKEGMEVQVGGSGDVEVITA